MTGHLPKRSGGTRPNRRRARAAGTRRRRHPRQQRRRHADGALHLRPARGAPAHGRDQPARRDDGNGGLPRPAPRQWWRRTSERLLGRRSRRPGRLRRLRGDQVGINGWSEALRVELQPDIRVIVIEPGATATELPTTSPTPPASGSPRRPSTGPSRRATSPTSSPSPSAARSA